MISFHKLKRPLLITAETFLLTAVMLFSIFPLSCRVSLSGIEIIGTDVKMPVLENYQVIDSTHLSMSFSDEIKLLSAGLSAEKTEQNENEKMEIEYSLSEDNKTILVTLNEKTEIGRNYTFIGEVENSTGSTLTFSYSFTGFNDRIPFLLFTEIADGTLKKKDTTTYEYIELYSLSDGNLAGLRIVSLNDGEENSFTFPNFEIKKGEFITLHYRKNLLQEDLCITESEGDITASKAKWSSDSSWDFWLENTDSRLGASQDLIYLENTGNGNILQAIVYSMEDKTSWSKEIISQTLETCLDYKAWEGGTEVNSAVNFKTSATLQRTNLANIIEEYEKGDLIYPFPSNASQWTRVTQSALTPGY